MEPIKGSQYGLPGIGTNGNAVRISSGYAFAFIQKQANLIVKKIKNNVNEQLNVPIPHKSIDLFLDKIFIDVLKTYPEKAPDIFICLVSNINGDEMAEFMSGNASIKTYLKIIYAMPKIIFVVSFLKIFLKKERIRMIIELTLIEKIALFFVMIIGLPHGALDGAIALGLGYGKILKKSFYFCPHIFC